MTVQRKAKGSWKFWPIGELESFRYEKSIEFECELCKNKPFDNPKFRKKSKMIYFIRSKNDGTENTLCNNCGGILVGYLTKGHELSLSHIAACKTMYSAELPKNYFKEK